jgi:hypothetical protein
MLIDYLYEMMYIYQHEVKRFYFMMDHLLEMSQHQRINAIYNQLMEDPF